MYLYPDNLKAKTTLFLWDLRDMVIIILCVLLSALILINLGIFIPLVMTVVYAILTIRFEEVSIFDFLCYAVDFFLSKQQLFFWRSK